MLRVCYTLDSVEGGAFGQKHTSVHVPEIASQNNAGLFSGKLGYLEYSALQLLIIFWKVL